MVRRGDLMFELVTKMEPCGDQPAAIETLSKGVENDLKHQVLLGVTGSGKTFTMANVIARVQRPTLIIAPHIVSTLDSSPGAWSNYGWGTETFVDFVRMWVAGAMAMFLYGILRKASLSN